MEIIYLIVGLIVGAVACYFTLKARSVSKKDHDELNMNWVKTKSDFEHLVQKKKEDEEKFNNEKDLFLDTQNILNEIQLENKTFLAEKKFLTEQIATLKYDLVEKNKSIEEMTLEKNESIAIKSDILAKNKHLQTQLDNQKEEIIKLQEMAKNEFQNLANKILEEKTEKFTQQNEQNIKTLLTPLQEKISDFEKKVENTHKESIDYHAALRQQIVGLKELNQQMSKEAVNLTKALKGDNKIQGNWGELILENVLVKSGLEKDREYEIQKSHTTDEGRLQPDVIIHLPDGKKMIIDSKVSLNAYEKYINEEDEIQKSTHLQEHLNSIKRHTEQLSAKNYQQLYHIESPDFVLMFVPIEPAFALALNEDTDLYNKAFAKNIVIVTPSTLLATLKTIDSMWTNQKQQDNAIEIARQAGALYDKFEGFVVDLIKLGKKMDDAKIDYEAAMNKLVSGKGNLVKSTQKLKLMGAKAKKSLPEGLLKRSNIEDNMIEEN
ncbi:DNA recombination protein RmuC [Amniculibacterium sp. G2-70]|uniref:DNA recombination protein RmuC n=1 Tax=Amniculibacterium sp. G2-70 TaxID=2767188 RepID=UPI0016542C80|nr:DNA recombination protein RmuC [Amniculibacterium sp. G2-70]